VGGIDSERGYPKCIEMAGRNSSEYAIDFAIIDYLLPDRDGFEVLQLIRDMDALQKEGKRKGINTLI
jgi:hypothetical protein